MNSFISWVGGKMLLRKQITSLFPENIGRYIEVFGGAAWVLFYSEKYAELEVYNDIDSNLVNLFKCVKFHSDELQRYILPINSRELFQNLLERQNIHGQTDIQRAADFFMLIRTSYGANRKQFGCNTKSIEKSLSSFTNIQNRLSKVVIENKSFDNLIKVYDRENALFYCDPPYHGTEKMYDAEFGEADHILLHDHLSKIKGKFILSYNDDDFIRNLYKDFKILPVERANNLSLKSNGGAYKELIIMNY